MNAPNWFLYCCNKDAGSEEAFREHCERFMITVSEAEIEERRNGIYEKPKHLWAKPQNLWILNK